MTTDDSPTARPHSGRYSVQIDERAKKRVDRLAKAVGLPRGQVVEWLVNRGSQRELLAELKAADLSPAPRGRKKLSIFGKG